MAVKSICQNKWFITLSQNVGKFFLSLSVLMLDFRNDHGVMFSIIAITIAVLTVTNMHCAPSPMRFWLTNGCSVSVLLLVKYYL